MTRRHTAFIASALLLAALPLAAFAEPPFGRGPRHGPGLGRLLPPPGYLELTDEQLEATKALVDEARATLEPLREEGRTLRQALREALDGENPDAASVGRMVIDLDGLKDRRRAELEKVEERFAALLTEEQLSKWENWKELRRSHRERMRGRMGGRFGERGPRGPGFAGPDGL